MVRHPGEGPGQEAADHRPAGGLEVQLGRQLPERAGNASEMRTVSGAEVPRSEPTGMAVEPRRVASGEGQEERIQPCEGRLGPDGVAVRLADPLKEQAVRDEWIVTGQVRASEGIHKQGGVSVQEEKRCNRLTNKKGSVRGRQ